MEGSIKLGGNIELFGAQSLEGAKMVVLKKIVGSYARKFSEKGLERLAVSFGASEVRVDATVQGSTFSSIANHENMFFGLDAALKDVETQFVGG